MPEDYLGENADEWTKHWGEYVNPYGPEGGR